MKKYTWIIILLSLLGAKEASAQSGKDDNKSIGTVYFEDCFDWISPEFGGQDYLDGSFATAGPRLDGVPPHLKPILDASGWTTSAKFVYLRTGYLQIGRQADGGNIISPKLERQTSNANLGSYSRVGIEPEKEVDVEVSFDIAIYRGVKGNKDLNTIVVAVLNAGKIKDEGVEKVIKVDSWNKWKKVVVPVSGATSDTRILIRPAQERNERKAARFFLDNFKVIKAK